MWLSNAVMIAMTAILFGLAVWKNKGVPFAALKDSGKTLLMMAPVILCAFMCEGLIKTLVPPSWVQKWLATEAGWRGIVIGCIAGALTPGGPYTSFPIAMLLLRSGAGIGTVVAYMTAWQIWSLTRYPMEIAFVGLNITMLRFIVTFFVPPFAGFLAQWLTTSGIWR
ncbi:MAG: permease [Armatimonadetes bacterium]|nr:permease [Armatimonadota bacterium]MDW8029344.1 permease [Armatimonadota bacterium]